MKATIPGELIQVDHAYIQLSDGTWICHFEAICPLTKIAVQQAYHRAPSTAADNFLHYAREQFPFAIRSLQVDGGSEFMGEFEIACQKADIQLFVLPPKRPQYNGTVERVHATVKYEFYRHYFGSSSLPALRAALARYNHRYNTYRPHQSLDLLTPWCYSPSTHNRKATLGHAGGTGSFSAYLFNFLSSDVSFIVLSNYDNFDTFAQEFFAELEDIVFGLALE